MKKPVAKDPHREKIEKKIAQLMTLAANDPDLTTRQIARQDAAKLRLQLGMV
jgi:hypothetical protein